MYKRGITQRWLARRIKVSESRLSRILRRKFRSRAAERRCIADALGVSLSEVFPRRRARRCLPRRRARAS
ncbi:MAG: helix-turn-helix domain-containing protein [Candidatus Acidiferrales bacterium]